MNMSMVFGNTAVPLTAARRMRLAFMLALPSVAWSLAYHKPKLVLDVLLLWSLEPFLPRWAQMALRAAWIALCGAMLLLEWNIYPESYLFYLGMVPSIAGSQQGMAAIATLLLLGLFIAVPAGPVSRLRPKHFLWAVLALYACTTALKLSPWGRDNLVNLRLPLLRALQVAATAGPQIGAVSVVGKQGADSVHGRLHERLQPLPGNALPDKILMVVLESWGESADGLQQLVDQLSVQNFEILEAGHTRYRGSTLPGEIRELCGRLMDFKEIGFSGQGCLPRKLTPLGFQTTAFHGYEGFFYYRNIIYPSVGFANSKFRPQLQGLPECLGAFKGTCDDALAQAALRQLAEPGKQFVYMMSLSAHEPVAPETLQRPYVTQAPPTTGLTETQVANRALVHFVARHIDTTPGLNHPVLIYVVGDHNPPSASDDKNAFPAEKVPFILFRSRQRPQTPA